MQYSKYVCIKTCILLRNGRIFLKYLLREFWYFIKDVSALISETRYKNQLFTL